MVWQETENEQDSDHGSSKPALELMLFNLRNECLRSKLPASTRSKQYQRTRFMIGIWCSNRVLRKFEHSETCEKQFPGVQKTELQARELRKPALASSILFTNFYQCQFYNLPKSLSHDFPRSTGLPYFRWFVSLWAVTETLQQSGVMHAPFSRQRLSGVKGKHAAKRDEQRKRTENPGLQASIEVIRLCHVEAKLFTSNQGWSSQSSHAWKEFALQKVGSQMCIQRRKTQKMLECILERMVEACLADSSRLLFLEHRWCSYFHASVRGVWRQHFKMQTGGTKRCTTYSNISNPVLERWKEGNVEALDQVQAAV